MSEPLTSKTRVDLVDLRCLAADCEGFNNTPPIHADEYLRLYLRVTRYAPRYLNECADKIERMETLLRVLREKSARVHPELMDQIDRELAK